MQQSGADEHNCTLLFAVLTAALLPFAASALLLSLTCYCSRASLLSHLTSINLKFVIVVLNSPAMAWESIENTHASRSGDIRNHSAEAGKAGEARGAGSDELLLRAWPPPCDE